MTPEEHKSKVDYIIRILFALLILGVLVHYYNSE